LLRFLTVGVLNTALGLGFIYTAMALGAGLIAANAIGYALGILVSFVANRRWTFAHRGDWRPALARWLVVTAIAYSAQLAVVIALGRGLGSDPRLAQIAGIPVYLALTFVGGRSFAFAAPAAVRRST